MNLPAYCLCPDASHLVDVSYDIALIEGPRTANVIFSGRGDLGLETPLLFEANLGALKTLDYPVTRPAGLPIMSKRMLETLIKVGPFNHRALPVAMIDDSVSARERYEPGGKLRADIVDPRFVFAQLTSYTDAFDWERSEYERDDKSSHEVVDIRKFVLRDVPLPPLFRLSAYPYELYVSAAARAALEVAGIRGIDFAPYWLGFGAP